MKIAIALPVILFFFPLFVLADDGLPGRIDALLEQLRSGDLSMSRSASLALHALGEDGRLHIISLLGADDSLARRKAILGLEAIGGSSSAGAIIEIVDDPDPRVRADAVRALGRLRVGKAFRLVLARLDDPAPPVRAAAVGALADLGSRQAVKPVAEMTPDPDPGVRAAAAYALGRLGDRSASTLLCLKVLLRDGEWRVRRNAAISLGEVGNRLVEKDLVAALSDEDPWVRSASVRALGRLKAETAHRQARDTAPRQARDIALAGIRGLLKDESSTVRASAAETLGELKDVGSLKGLACLLEDDSPSGIYLSGSMRELMVAEVAAGSLGRITGDNRGYEREFPEEKRRKALDRWRSWAKGMDIELTPEQKQKIQDSNIKIKISELNPRNAWSKDRREKAKQQLIKIGKPAGPALFEALKNGHVRMQDAVEIFKAMGKKECVTYLREFMNDENNPDWERAAAANYIAEFGEDPPIPALVQMLNNTQDDTAKGFIKQLLTRWTDIPPVYLTKMSTEEDYKAAEKIWMSRYWYYLAKKAKDLELAKSEKYIRKAIDSYGLDQQYWTFLAELSSEKGDTQAAEEQRLKAKQVKEEEEKEISIKSAIWNRQRRFEELDKEIEKDPGNVELWIEKGLFYISFRDFEKALEAFNKAYELKPGDPSIRNKIAASYAAIGKVNEAIVFTEETLKKFPDDEQAKALLDYLHEMKP